MALKWISEYCSNVTYLLKIDDDIVVNIFALLRHLEILSHHDLIKPKTIMCNLWTRMKVVRDKESKWYEYVYYVTKFYSGYHIK